MLEVKIQLKQQNLGCKIYHGPYVYNFKEIYEIFENNISKEIKNPEEFSKKI